jgi:hypothetical protein
MAQVVEYLFSKCEALSTAKNKQPLLQGWDVAQ